MTEKIKLLNKAAKHGIYEHIITCQSCKNSQVIEKFHGYFSKEYQVIFVEDIDDLKGLIRYFEGDLRVLMDVEGTNIPLKYNEVGYLYL